MAAEAEAGADPASAEWEAPTRLLRALTWLGQEFLSDWEAQDLRAALFQLLLLWLVVSLLGIQVAWRVYGNTVTSLYYRQGRAPRRSPCPALPCAESTPIRLPPCAHPRFAPGAPIVCPWVVRAGDQPGSPSKCAPPPPRGEPDPGKGSILTRCLATLRETRQEAQPDNPTLLYNYFIVRLHGQNRATLNIYLFPHFPSPIPITAQETRKGLLTLF